MPLNLRTFSFRSQGPSYRFTSPPSSNSPGPTWVERPAASRPSPFAPYSALANGRSSRLRKWNSAAPALPKSPTSAWYTPSL